MKVQIYKILVLVTGTIVLVCGCSFKKSHDANLQSPQVEAKKFANEDELQSVLSAKLEKQDVNGLLNYAFYNDLGLDYVIKEKDKTLAELLENVPVQELSKPQNVSLIQSIENTHPVSILKNQSLLVVAGKTLDKVLFKQVIQALMTDLKKNPEVGHDSLQSQLEEVALEAVDNKSFGEVIESGRLASRFEWIKFKLETIGSVGLLDKTNVSVKVLNSYLYSQYIKENPSKAMELIKALDSAKVSWNLTSAEQTSVFSTMYALGLPEATNREMTLFFLNHNRSSGEVLTSECDLATPYILDPVIKLFADGNEEQAAMSLQQITTAIKGQKNYCDNGIDYIVRKVTDDSRAARVIKMYVQIEGLSTEDFIKKLRSQAVENKRLALVAKVRELIPEEQKAQFDLYVQMASNQ
ncbi:MAG TPA: hypothetical protein VF412_10820 [Bdellovibrio sp.]|uniref:hypothetical protein n=1 Tax=Bdellovibrio sp. TaxID=28201 RepID=UPI002F04F1B2